MWMRAGRRGAVARRWCNLGAGALLVASGVSGPARAIDITTTYRPPLSNAPASDPDGSQLSALFSAAADHYEDIFEDPDHTLEVEFYYFDFFNTSTVGNTTLATQSNGRATKVFITLGKRPLGNEYGWYFDPDPDSHSEFNLQQTLAGDLSGGQQSDYFNGSVPDTLEVGYRGNASGGGASGKLDAYTLVLHEMGHALGMLSTNTSTQNETYDGDYDFDPGLVGGFNTAAENIPGNISHLEAPATLMYPYFSLGERKLPAATDLLSMAAGHGYDQIDLQRIDFLADGNNSTWSPDNWVGGRNPEPGDDVFIRSEVDGPAVVMQADQTVRNLTVSRRNDLDLNNRRLTVTDTLTLRDFASDVDVKGGTNAVLAVGTLDVGDQAEVMVKDGGRIEAGVFELHSGATLILDGRATVNGHLRFHGTVEVRSGAGTKRLDGIREMSNNTRFEFDLDGGTPGQYGALDLDYDGSPPLPEGTLVLNTNYTPQLGDTLRLIDHTDAAGSRLFAQVEGDEITSALRWAVDYGADHLDVIAALAGDTDFDGDVDFADAMTLRRSFSTAAAEPSEGFTWSDGDYDHDGDVDFDDAVTLAAGFTGRAGAHASEPPDTTLALLADPDRGTLVLRGDAKSLMALSVISESGALALSSLTNQGSELVLRSSAQEWSAVRLNENETMTAGLPLAWSASSGEDLVFRYAQHGQWQAKTGRVILVPEPAAVLPALAGGLLTLMWPRKRTHARTARAAARAVLTA